MAPIVTLLVSLLQGHILVVIQFNVMTNCSIIVVLDVGVY